MSLEDRCRYLEVQNITLNERLWELSSRVANIEQLLTNHVTAYPNPTNQLNTAPDLESANSSKSEELYRKLSTLAFEFNTVLPAVAAAIRNNHNQNAGYYDDPHRNTSSNRVKDDLGHGNILGSNNSSNQVLPQHNQNQNTQNARPGTSTYRDAQRGPNTISNPMIPVISVTSDTVTGGSNAHQPVLPQIVPKNREQQRENSKFNSHGIEMMPSDQQSKKEVQNYVILPPVSTPMSSNENKGMGRKEVKSDSPSVTPTELKRQSKSKRDHRNGDTYGEESSDTPWEGSDNNMNPGEDQEDREKSDFNNQGVQSKTKVETHSKLPVKSLKHPPRCKKLCNKTTGHACGQPHDPSSPCPPCIVLIKDMKLKCNHRVTILCHRKNKVSDICSECDSKKQVSNENNGEKSIRAPPSLTLALDPIQSPGEIAFKKFREILNKITMSNFEKLSDDFVETMKEQTKYLPEIANILLERAIIDMDNPLSAVCYSQLAAKVVEDSQERELQMFRIELITLVFAVFSNFFGCHNSCSGSSSVYVNNILRRKEIAESDVKRRKLGILRFIGELYNKDVIKLVDLKNNVIDPFIDQTSVDQTDFLCKILTLVGHRINSEILDLAKGPPTSPDPELPSAFWFNELFIRLESICDDPNVNAAVRFSITNLIELKQVGWDRFKKNSTYTNGGNTNSTPYVPSCTNNTYSVESDPCQSENVSEKSKKRRKKRSSPRVERDRGNETRSPSPLQPQPLMGIEHLLPPNTPDYSFDSWSTAPWGDHTDPLAAAFTPLERSDSPVIPSMKGSRSQSTSRRTTPEPPNQVRRNSLSFSDMPMSRSQSMLSVNTPSVSTATNPNPRLTAGKPPPNPVAMTNKRVENLFIEYMKRHASPKLERKDWVQKKFFHVAEPQRAEFVRALSRLAVRQLTKVQLAGIGHILDVMMSAQIVSQETILKCFSGGIISDFPKIYNENQNDYPEIIAKSAYILVTLFNNTMTNLDWLVRVGKNLRAKHELIWFEFSCEIMMLIMDRKRHKGILKLWKQTEVESQNILEEQAVQVKVI